MGFLDFARQFWSDIKAAWAKLSLSARVNIGLAGAAVMVVILFVAFSGAPSLYRTLASGVGPGALSQIRTLLEEQGVDYKIEGDDKVLVSVSPKEFDALRLSLVENVIPLTRSVLPGFEILLDSDMMASKWMQDTKFIVAVQGRLQKQLNEFEAISYSRVTIREARSALFRNEQQDSEASVTLALKRKLTDREIAGIVKMVAASGGPHLTPNNVIMMDTDMNTLWSPAADDMVSTANSRHEHIAYIERAKEEKILGILTNMGVLATVAVSAKTNWDQVEETSNEILDGQPLSEAVIEITNTSTETLPQGSPGVLAGVPEASASAGTIELSETEIETIINNENGRRFTVTKTTPGDVVQYLAALVIAEEYGPDTVDADTGDVVAGEPMVLSQEELDTYENIAMMALAGGELAPEIYVTSHPFKVDRLAASVASAAEAAASMEYKKQMAWQATQILMIIVFFFLARVLLRRVIQLPGELVEEEEVAEIPEATREDIRRQEVAAQVAQLAEENPETVALLLRAWINETED